MFWKKAKRLKELERKIDCYVAGKSIDEGTIKDQQRLIDELLEENKNNGKALEIRNKQIKLQKRKIDQFENKIKILEQYTIAPETKTLEEIRLCSKLTKTQVAHKMNAKSIYYLSQVENGKVNPSVGYLGKLADIYNMPLVRIVESFMATLDTKDTKDVSEVEKCQKK